jgi:hypothetical protein
MGQRLSAAQVAELAELLEEASVRVGVVDEILQAAAEVGPVTLVLTSREVRKTAPVTPIRVVDG